jgi:anti-anti-sigma factor
MTDVDIPSDIATVMLPEAVDSINAAEVERSMMDAIRPGSRVIVDGSAVSYLGAAGVRALAVALHKAADVRAHIVLCRFSGAAADCLVVSGFSSLFDVAKTVEEAVARLRPKLAATASERLHLRGATG